MSEKKKDVYNKVEEFDVNGVCFSNEKEFPCLISGEKALVVGLEEWGIGSCIKGCNLCRVNMGRVTIESGVVVKCDDGSIHSGIMALRQVRN